MYIYIKYICILYILMYFVHTFFKRSPKGKISNSCHDTVWIEHVTHLLCSISFSLTQVPLTQTALTILSESWQKEFNSILARLYFGTCITTKVKLNCSKHTNIRLSYLNHFHWVRLKVLIWNQKTWLQTLVWGQFLVIITSDSFPLWIMMRIEWYHVECKVT